MHSVILQNFEDRLDKCQATLTNAEESMVDLAQEPRYQTGPLENDLSRLKPIVEDLQDNLHSKLKVIRSNMEALGDFSVIIERIQGWLASVREEAYKPVCSSKKTLRVQLTRTEVRFSILVCLLSKNSNLIRQVNFCQRMVEVSL